MYNYLEEIALKLLDLFIDHDLWTDTRIYFHNKAYCSDDYRGKHAYSFARKDATVFVIENISPHDYCSYCGDLLTIASEPVLNNFYTPSWLLNEITYIVAPYGLFFDFGDNWNISLYRA